MKFDVYFPFLKDGKMVPGVKPVPMEWNDIAKKLAAAPALKEKLEAIRAESDKDKQADMKKSLPAVNFVGRSSKTRAAKYMTPTQLVMVDVDHCTDARGAWQRIVEERGNAWIVDHIMVAHLTPRLGLHIIFKAQEGFTTLQGNMDWLNETLQLERFGDYDAVTKDFARVSFMFAVDELLFENGALYLNTELEFPQILKNEDYEEKMDTTRSEVSESVQASNGKGKTNGGRTGAKNAFPVLTEEQKEKYDRADYRGVPLRKIIDKWLEVVGEPGENEIHNWHNEFIKYFRNIMGNNKELIFHLIPRFGHSDEEVWSQIKSICRVNTLSDLPRPFYFFLKDNGFYVSRWQASLDNYMLSDEDTSDLDGMPLLPPVFREFVRSAPKDFRIPVINALMPIMGTLTSYLQAVYPYDDENHPHTTSFFSIIYAPPGTGKSFVNRFEFLFDDLRLRDEVQSIRENLYLNFIKRCDENTYEEPCTAVISDIEHLDQEEFDKTVPWRFKFKPRQTVDMDWIMPTINEFHEEQVKRASLDLDKARDVFRRRVGVRGFRLALLCTALYPTLNSRAMDTIRSFVAWWMQVDLENMLKLWGAKYNDVAEVEPHLYNRNAFKSLKDTFTKSDLLAVMKQQNIKSKIYNVVYQWKKEGYIEVIGKDEYKKKKKYETGA